MATFNSEDTFAYLLGIWIPVQSSNVASARYHADEEILEVEFDSGRFYQYLYITHYIAEAFANASSKGKFVWDWFIRSKWPFIHAGFLAGVRQRRTRPRGNP